MQFRPQNVDRDLGIKIVILELQEKDASRSVHGLADVCEKCVCSQKL